MKRGGDNSRLSKIWNPARNTILDNKGQCGVRLEVFGWQSACKRLQETKRVVGVFFESIFYPSFPCLRA